MDTPGDLRATVGTALADGLRAAGIDRRRIGKAMAEDKQRATTVDGGVAGSAAGRDGLGAAVQNSRDGLAEISLRALAEHGRTAGNTGATDDLLSAADGGAGLRTGHAVGAAAVDEGADRGAAGQDVEYPPPRTWIELRVWPDETASVPPLLTVPEKGTRVISVPLVPSDVTTNWSPEKFCEDCPREVERAILTQFRPSRPSRTDPLRSQTGSRRYHATKTRSGHFTLERTAGCRDQSGQWCDDRRPEFARTNWLCLASVASSAGNMHSSRSSSAVTVSGVPTVVIIEK
jgi:hypothetical protein